MTKKQKLEKFKPIIGKSTELKTYYKEDGTKESHYRTFYKMHNIAFFLFIIMAFALGIFLNDISTTSEEELRDKGFLILSYEQNRNLESQISRLNSENDRLIDVIEKQISTTESICNAVSLNTMGQLINKIESEENEK